MDSLPDSGISREAVAEVLAKAPDAFLHIQHDHPEIANTTWSDDDARDLRARLTPDGVAEALAVATGQDFNFVPGKVDVVAHVIAQFAAEGNHCIAELRARAC